MSVHGALKFRSLRAEKEGQIPRDKSRPWSSSELSRLRQLAHLGQEGAAIALGRTPRSVRRAADRYNISLRRPGETRGLVQGQPRGVSFAQLARENQKLAVLRELRQDLIAGEVDVRSIYLIASRKMKLARGAQLCPGCAVNPQEHDETGLCRDCHLIALADAHRGDSAMKHAQRELWRERQRKVRRKRRGEQ